MNTKNWKDDYKEIYELTQKISSKDKVDIKDNAKKMESMINAFNSFKEFLIGVIEERGLYDEKGREITVNDLERYNLAELLLFVNFIGYDYKGEQGGETPDYDFLANIEVLPQGEMKVGSYVFKTYMGRGMEGEFPIFRNLREVGLLAFESSKFTGEFPKMDNLEILKDRAFRNSKFTGEFPKLENLREIGKDVFRPSEFTGEFPKMDNLETIGDNSFRVSKFTGEFPLLPNIKEINTGVFLYSNFTGNFPLLPNIEEIGYQAFYRSNFTGELPYMETLEAINRYAFNSSNFDKDENGFVKNYPGWNGKDEWNKPASYRVEMTDEIPPKLMTIFAPGGEMEVYDDIQGERARKYLEENEPSDVDYYLEYVKKLREIGFERDEFGNYVDVVNDKSVIIIPEDIKFMV